MTFEKLDQSVTDAWREEPVTEAFIAYVANERAALVSDLLNALKGGSSPKLDRIGGQLEVMDRFLDTLVRR